MSSKKEIIEIMVKEIFNNNNLDYYDILFTKDMESHMVLDELDINNVENMKSMMDVLQNCFSNLMVKSEEIISERDKAFALFKFSGIHDKDKFMGMEPKGKKIEFESYNIFYFKKNQISFHRGITNVIHQLKMIE
ncbi:ester cyclase [Aureivirga marina]|uniref:ester cyclase n=1 Tax=Aureivirga marina TaxID=1182451 RepID=UPI0018CBBE17|nr:ester cyclase [Aureivirga marina]